ncbi:MAG: hypothetical protein JJ858_03905 [Rhizobiaceae bacterium]|nr:hypothetical protein [Rhizobiaceae bacterium]
MKFYFPRRDNLIVLAIMFLVMIGLFWLSDWGQSFFDDVVERRETLHAILIIITLVCITIMAYAFIKGPIKVIEITDLGITDIRLNADTLPWLEIENIELYKEGSKLCKQPHILIHMPQDFVPIIKPQTLLGVKIPHKPVKAPFIIRKSGFSTRIENIYLPMLSYWEAAKSKNDAI